MTIILTTTTAWSKETKKPAKKASAPAASPASISGLPLLLPATGPLTIAVILQRFQEFDAKINTLSADFRQSVQMEQSGTTQVIEGAVEYLKPDRLRIEHKKPEKQTVVSDGKSLWVWRRETNQVIQTGLAEWKKSEPLAQGLMDFGNYAALLKRYDVSIETATAPGSDGHRSATLLLKPWEAGADFTLRLSLTTRDYFPSHAELRAGQLRITSHFDDVKINGDIPTDRFQFTPPAGADIFPNFKPPRIP